MLDPSGKVLGGLPLFGDNRPQTECLRAKARVTSRLAPIVTASHTENDMSDGSGAEARL